ncbi:Uncharacterized protein At4g14450, chloroplastic [Linum perenne]
MTDKQRNGSTKISTSSSSAAAVAGQSSRLQRRRPASLQINPASSSFWNAAIPLLSPLETSPTAIERKEQQQQQNQILNQQRGGETDKPIVFKKWQHPAAPFCYEPEKLKPSFFVPV